MNLFENIVTCVKNNGIRGSNVFHYMDFVDGSEMVPKMKSEIRELSIGNIFGKINDGEFLDKKKKIIEDINSYSSGDTISAKLLSQTVNSNHYNDVDDLNDIVLKYLVSISNLPHPHRTKTGINFDIKSNTNTNISSPSSFSRFVLAGILKTSNSIAAYGRRGPGNVLIVGSDIIPIIQDVGGFNSTNSNVLGSIGQVAGVDVFYNPYLNSNRMISLRKDKTIESGVNLVWGDNNLYCLFNTGQFWRQMIWFDVI